MIIAIDGPAGAGKSTVSKLVALSLNFKYLDTGAMYRAVTWKVLTEKTDIGDEMRVAAVARSSKIRFELASNDGVSQRVFLNDGEVTEEIRSPRVTGSVSAIAAMSSVRKVLVDLQRGLIQGENFVLEGRDTGTVVCPTADLKIFLTATPKERARRRYLELKEKGLDVELSSIERDIIKRDYLDSSRKDSPLIKARDAFLLDTTGLTIDQVAQQIISRVPSNFKV